MDIAFPEITLNLMRQIKGVFDPYRILNPGKIF
jgi:FAD/FMN-containing dehydrogenase